MPSPSKAFVYTELQIALPFADVPWADLNADIRRQPGFANKTWLSGIATQSVGGFYEFDSIANAKAFVTGYFPGEARKFGVAQTTRVFDGEVVEEASRYLNSMHFGGTLGTKPGAFVYTEVQLSVPFDQVPWRVMNPVLKVQPGLLHKTWLSGADNLSPGGIYAFDTIENARAFVTDYFPTEGAALNAAYTTRLFDAAVVEQASRDMGSPYFA